MRKRKMAKSKTKYTATIRVVLFVEVPIVAETMDEAVLNAAMLGALDVARPAAGNSLTDNSAPSIVIVSAADGWTY
jgi:hypothetical protein